MRDAMHTNQSGRFPVRVLRATLASLGFGRKSAASDSAEHWTAPTGRLSVTIHASNRATPAARAAHRIGNVQIYEMPPGATVDDRFLRLSPAELSILVVLARSQQRFVPLLDLSRSFDAGAALSLPALSVHVHALRRKLAKCNASARITTKRSVGYMLSAVFAEAQT
jgi:DNA-binding response OmpR family regulator